jgi:hypothetical protein
MINESWDRTQKGAQHDRDTTVPCVTWVHPFELEGEGYLSALYGLTKYIVKQKTTKQSIYKSNSVINFHSNRP